MKTDPASDGVQCVLTLIVHGTFAADESWWRLGTLGTESFADRLEAALSRRGCHGSVWRPALDRSFGYERFAWSGRNRDRDRREGAHRLAESLEALAAELGATSSRPVLLNLVAHSHGGNVVLEALCRLSYALRIGRVVLLGTPLIEERPALRLFRFGLSCVMATMLFAFLIYAIALCVCLPLIAVGSAACHDLSVSGPWLYWMPLLLPLVLAFYGWMLRGFAYVADLAWRAVLSPFWGLWAAKQSYGPRASVLGDRLAGQPIVLISCADDEAGLLLQLGAAPGRLYAAYVAATFSPFPRALERIFLRSIVVGLLLRVSELLLERWVLGFSWRSVFFFDYDLAELEHSRAYPRQVFERIDVSDRLSSARPPAPVQAPIEAAAGGAKTHTAHAIAAELLSAQAPGPDAQHATRRALGLLENLEAVRMHIVSQIKLRHSLYYESNTTLDLIADAIAGPPQPRSSAVLFAGDGPSRQGEAPRH